MIAWTWDATAPGAAACGVSDDGDRAREHAEEWLRAHPRGTARLGQAVLADGTATLAAWWQPLGERLRSRRHRDGSVTWTATRPAESLAPQAA